MTATPSVFDICRSAVARGPLIKDGCHYRFGRRLFSGSTVRAIMEACGPVAIIARPRKRGRAASRYAKPFRHHVRFSSATQASLKTIAAAEGVPITEIIRRMVTAGIAARDGGGRG